jgi:hypothetical protein
MIISAGWREKRCPFGDQARAVDSAPLFKAPLFRLDGILGRVRAQILCTRLIDPEPLLRGSEEKALNLYVVRRSDAPTQFEHS